MGDRGSTSQTSGIVFPTGKLEGAYVAPTSPKTDTLTKSDFC
ncbi:MAG: hypothetical protein Q8755_02505 [Candidatus Phytoplasma australasiaticum]|nr:hypothetical protein [Candidatus Phytoplasma australasiaticum]